MMDSLNKSNTLQGRMNNRLLSITRNFIAYMPELNPISGGILPSILMQQLDYWFHRYPDGYWKFLAPCGHLMYKEGDSWTEEIGMSQHEFRTAFDSIGYRHGSKSAFLAAPDKFLGRMYASYVDKRANLTYYIRNHALVDQKLDELVARGTPARPQPPENKANVDSRSPVDVVPQSTVASYSQVPVNRQSQVTGDGQYQSPVDAKHRVTVNSTPPAPGDVDHQSHEVGNSHLLGMQSTALPTTDNTVQNTFKQLPQTEQEPAAVVKPSSLGGGSSLNESQSQKLFYPLVTGKELNAIEKVIDLCRPDARQDVLDEIEGIRLAGGIKRGAVPLATALVKRVAAGEFGLSAGVAVQAQRERRASNELAVQAATAPAKQGGMLQLSEDVISKLPKHMADRAREALAKQAA